MIKGDTEMITKEYEKNKLIQILSGGEDPVKAKALGDLCQYIQEFRESKEVCICSKPGPKGGYFLSNSNSDISSCERWINNWRKSMNINEKFLIL